MNRAIIETRLKNIIFDNLHILADKATQEDQLDNLDQYTQDNLYNIIYDKINTNEYINNYKKKLPIEILRDIYNYSYYYEDKEHYELINLWNNTQQYNKLLNFYAHYRLKNLISKNNEFKKSVVYFHLDTEYCKHYKLYGV
jgi:hypothetical protein